MPRYRRETAPGCVQHIVSRFTNREFRLEQPHARREYLRRAGTILERTDWCALGFALMSSHVHWAMRAGSTPSSTVIKPLHTGFAGWLNAVEGRLGPVFAQRHRALVFEGETAAVLLSYIHNNPVRAGVVSDPADSCWTSHRAYLGLVPAPRWLNVEYGLSLCGFSATPSGRLAFHQMVVSRSSELRRIDLSGGDLQERRRCIRTELALPVELGTPRVRDDGGRHHVEVRAIVPDLSPARSRWGGSVHDVLALVARRLRIDAAQLCSRSRQRSITEARRVALSIWTSELARPANEIAAALGIASSSAAELIATTPPALRRVAARLASELRGEEADALPGISEIPRTVP